MIKWLKSLFGTEDSVKIIDENKYPYFENVRSEKATGFYSTYTIKVVWSDGSEDLMECEGWELDSKNNLVLKFMEEPKAKMNGSMPQLRVKTEAKRFIDDTDRRYWEVTDAESHQIEKQVEYGEKITWNDYVGLECKKMAIKSEEDEYKESE